MLRDLAAPLTAISRSVIPSVGCFSCTSHSQVTCFPCVFQVLSHLTFQTCFPFPPVFFSFKTLQLWCQYSQVFCCLEAESAFFNISAVLCESGAWDADTCFSSPFSVSSNTCQHGQVNKSGCLPCHKCEHPSSSSLLLAMLHIPNTFFMTDQRLLYSFVHVLHEIFSFAITNNRRGFEHQTQWFVTRLEFVHSLIVHGGVVDSQLYTEALLWEITWRTYLLKARLA